MDKFYQALAYLLPTGFAWPRDPDSTLMRVLRGVAASFGELHSYTGETVRQWQPHSTVSRLAEWEAATGLPDACFGADQSDAQRRKLLMARLRGPALAYEDSSPSSPGGLAAICRWLGFENAVVRYNTPFRCGSRVGHRVGLLNGKLYVSVTLESVRFRVGASRVGERLIQPELDPAQLACYLQRVVPARFSVELDVTFI